VVHVLCADDTTSPDNTGPAACGRATYGVEMTAVAASRPRLPAARCGATKRLQLIGDGAVSQRGMAFPKVRGAAAVITHDDGPRVFLLEGRRECRSQTLDLRPWARRPTCTHRVHRAHCARRAVTLTASARHSSSSANRDLRGHEARRGDSPLGPVPSSWSPRDAARQSRSAPRCVEAAPSVSRSGIP